MKKLPFLLLIACFKLTLAQPWYEIPSGTNHNLNVIEFINVQIGFIGGDDSILLKTLDAGRTWQPASTQGIQFKSHLKDITHIEFIDDSTGYLAITNEQPNGEIYVTHDGGLSWSPGTNAGLCFPRTTYFFDASNGIIGGSDCFAGESVGRIVAGSIAGSQAIGTLNTSLYISSIQFLDNNFGLAAGNSPYIFRTTNGGVSWDSIATPIDTGISDLLIVNDTLAYATFPGGSSTGVLFTSNGGLTWDIDWTSATFFYPGFDAILRTRNERIYQAGQASFSGGFIQYETATSWIYYVVDQPLHGLATYGDSTVFAVGDSGYIITNTDPIFLAVNQVKKAPSFSVFPNPASEIVYIENPNKTDLHIDLINTGGSIVTSIRTDKESIISINTSQFPQGFYFLRIRDNEGTSTEKIIIQH